MFNFDDHETMKKVVGHLPRVGIGTGYGLPQTRWARERFASSLLKRSFYRVGSKFIPAHFLRTAATHFAEGLSRNAVTSLAGRSRSPPRGSCSRPPTWPRSGSEGRSQTSSIWCSWTRLLVRRCAATVDGAFVSLLYLIQGVISISFFRVVLNDFTTSLSLGKRHHLADLKSRAVFTKSILAVSPRWFFESELVQKEDPTKLCWKKIWNVQLKIYKTLQSSLQAYSGADPCLRQEMIVLLNLSAQRESCFALVCQNVRNSRDQRTLLTLLYVFAS